MQKYIAFLLTIIAGAELYSVYDKATWNDSKRVYWALQANDVQAKIDDVSSTIQGETERLEKLYPSPAKK